MFSQIGNEQRICDLRIAQFRSKFQRSPVARLGRVVKTQPESSPPDPRKKLMEEVNPIPYFVATVTVSVVTVLFVTPWIGRLARRMGAVATPGGRHVHGEVTPLWGGLSLALGSFLGLSVALGVPGIGFVGHNPLLVTFAATSLMIAIGMLDDLRHLSPGFKLATHFILATICWFGGVRIWGLGVPGLDKVSLIHPISYVVTVAWIVGVTNAINLLDGLDGLAAGVVAIVTATLMLTGLMGGTVGVFLLFTMGALCSSCLAFLFYNGHPARIFMGDTGSLFIGFLLANIAVLTFQKSTTATALGIPILVLGVPLADTAIAFSRRILTGRSPFVADRHHLHHVLHRIGVTRSFAVVVIHLGTGVLCVFALLSVIVDPRTIYLGVAALLCGLVWLYALARTHQPIKSDENQEAAESTVSEEALNVARAGE